MNSIENFPLDSIILFSLREFSLGNKEKRSFRGPSMSINESFSKFNNPSLSLGIISFEMLCSSAHHIHKMFKKLLSKLKKEKTSLRNQYKSNVQNKKKLYIGAAAVFILLVYPI